MEDLTPRTVALVWLYQALL